MIKHMWNVRDAARDQGAVGHACDVVSRTEFVWRQALDADAPRPERMRASKELGDIRLPRFQVDYTPGAE
jgi:hypothetical protein